MLAAAHGHLGNVEDNRAQWAEALGINPNDSLKHRYRILPSKSSANLERICDGLRKAGLAEGEFPAVEL